MNVKLLGALFVSLLLPFDFSSQEAITNSIYDGGSVSPTGSGYWGDFELSPVFLGQDYIINFSYYATSNDTHTFSLFWQNKLTTGASFIASYKEGEKNVSYYDVFYSNDWVNHKSYLSYGSIIKGTFTIPSSLLASKNQLFLLDYQTKEDMNYITSGSLMVSSPVGDERVNLANQEIKAPTIYSFAGGSFYKHERHLSLPSLKENYLAKNDVVPLSSLILSSVITSNLNKGSFIPDDTNLFLKISSHDLSAFPYPLSGFETISLPCKFVPDKGVGKFHLALRDGGQLIYPRKGDYSFSIENDDDDCFGRYGFAFSLERENPYMGSCQNADWCVGVE